MIACPATTRAANFPWQMIGWISLIASMLAHRAADVGAGARDAADLSRGVTVL